MTILNMVVYNDNMAGKKLKHDAQTCSRRSSHCRHNSGKITQPHLKCFHTLPTLQALFQLHF